MHGFEIGQQQRGGPHRCSNFGPPCCGLPGPAAAPQPSSLDDMSRMEPSQSSPMPLPPPASPAAAAAGCAAACFPTCNTFIAISTVQATCRGRRRSAPSRTAAAWRRSGMATAGWAPRWRRSGPCFVFACLRSHLPGGPACCREGGACCPPCHPATFAAFRWRWVSRLSCTCPPGTSRHAAPEMQHPR